MDSAFAGMTQGKSGGLGQTGLVERDDAQRGGGDAFDPEQALDQLGIEQEIAAEHDIGLAPCPCAPKAQHPVPLLAGERRRRPGAARFVLDLDFICSGCAGRAPRRTEASGS